MSEPARQRLDYRQRSHEQEWLDRDDIDPAELRAVLRDLARFNTAFFGHRPILRWLGRILGPETSGPAPTILDVGCGYGDLLRAIRRWSNKRNLKPTLLGVDLNPETIRIAGEVTDRADQIDFTVMDVFDLPPGRTFDIIVSSLVAHHLDDEKLRDFLVLLERSSSQGWLIYDLERSRLLHGFLGVASRLAGLHPMVTNDGQISVMRSLTRREWTDRVGCRRDRIVERQNTMVLVPFRDREVEGFSARNKMNSDVTIETSTPASFRTWVGFSMMCLGMFMAILDIQVVATSLPTIQGALNIAPDQMSWIQTAYLIAEIISIPLTGFLIRAATMRWLFTVATVVFILASIGCAFSPTFRVLIAFRVLQGFAGGTLIPTVFSAVFLMFPIRLQTVAATIAGVLAVLGPTIGPIVGGWITDAYSWPWLFLINVPAGLIASSVGFFSLPKHKPSLDQFRRLDFLSFALGAAALVALEIAIKDAPKQGWTSPITVGLIALFVISATLFVSHTRRSDNPLVDLGSFARRNFSIGCLLSFVLGMGLYGSVYLIPIFLAYARSHNAFDIGTTMLVTGLTQLIFAPVAAGLTRRVDERLLTGLGFAVFGVGLALSAYQTTTTDFNEMFWPQVVRGAAIMFCLLPPTEFALGELAPEAIPDASGLFNLMRNLGGAIGIAIIDTIIFSRSPQYAQTLVNELISGNLDAARSIGASMDLLSAALADPEKRAVVASLVQKSAFVRATNDAWAFVAAVTLIAIVSIPFVRRQSKRGGNKLDEVLRA